MKRHVFIQQQLTQYLAKATRPFTQGRSAFFQEHITEFSPVHYGSTQHFALTPELSDHLMVQYSTSSFQAASFNTMMQGRVNPCGRANTAFKLSETALVYIERYMRILEEVKTFLINNPDISIIAFQEAPIKEHAENVIQYMNEYFPDEWKIVNPDITHDLTDWGVFTLINHKRLQVTRPTLDESLTQNLDIKDIGIRCRTFAMIPESGGEIVKFTNLHLPHYNTENAFHALFNKVIDDVIQSAIKGETFRHHLIGDWNIDAERLNQLTQERIQSKLAEAGITKNPPVHISVTLYASYQGHLKQSGEKLSVDAMLSINVKPASSYKYSFQYAPVAPLMGTAVMLMLVLYLSARMNTLEEAMTTEVSTTLAPFESGVRF